MPFFDSLGSGSLIVLTVLIRVLFVPSILLGLLLLAWYIVRIPATADAEVAKSSAFTLGIVLFVLVMVLNLFGTLFKTAPNFAVFENPWGHLVVGFLIGAGLIWGVDRFVESKLISVFITGLASISLVALYFYTFIEAFRDPILAYTVSMLVGGLVYVVVVPSTFRVLAEVSEALTPVPPTPGQQSRIDTDSESFHNPGHSAA